MKIEIKNYWFSLKPHIYTEFKDYKILIYNTSNGDRIKSSSSDVVSLITEIYEPINLGVTKLDAEQLENSHIYDFIAESINKEMGVLYDINLTKPISLVPILSLQKDADKLDKIEQGALGENVSKPSVNPVISPQ